MILVTFLVKPGNTRAATGNHFVSGTLKEAIVREKRCDLTIYFGFIKACSDLFDRSAKSYAYCKARLRWRILWCNEELRILLLQEALFRDSSSHRPITPLHRRTALWTRAIGGVGAD